jgi:hypothetical protein
MEKSHVAGWDSESPTPTQLKEFFAQIDSHKITKKNLQNFLRRDTIFENEESTREILGEDIIFPDEITQTRGLSYSKKQLKQLASTLPAEETLRLLKMYNYALMPAPPYPMSFAEIWRLRQNLFHLNNSVKTANLKFANDEKTTFGWLAICKHATSKKTAFTINERLPNIAELAWFITTYYEIHKIKLLEDTMVRTSSVGLDYKHVFLKNFTMIGIVILCLSDDFKGQTVLVPAWKL